MSRRGLSQLVWGAAALGIALLTGCHNLGGRWAPSSAVQGEDPRVTAAQAADLHVALGRAAEKRGEITQAAAAYREAIRRDASRADAHLRLAVALDKQGKFRESADLYRRALEADPGNPDIYCDMGYSLYLQRRWAAAEMNLRQAIAKAPDHRRAHNNLGLVLAHDGRRDEALAEFRRGGCDAADAHNNLAFALTLEGRWDEARDYYRRAQDADPSSRIAGDRIRELDSLAAKVGSPPQPTGTGDPAVVTASAAGAPHPLFPATYMAHPPAPAGRPPQGAGAGSPK